MLNEPSIAAVKRGKISFITNAAAEALPIHGKPFPPVPQNLYLPLHARLTLNIQPSLRKSDSSATASDRSNETELETARLNTRRNDFLSFD
jgi:hypothetical protein